MTNYIHRILHERKKIFANHEIDPDTFIDILMKIIGISLVVFTMEDPIVELKSGFVRGLVEKHEDGFNFYSFRGIPYAEPPVGEFRFEDPIPKKSWNGVLDCKEHGPMSSQYDAFLQQASYDEDCLNLNVYTRSINRADENKAVIFVIHGGVFLFGSNRNTVYGPEYLIRKDVVLVNINYRLGPLGFLNLEDEVAPGNQGLKDQLLALQWNQQNIRKFGGDPENVTVFGLSAGAIAAHYLSLSRLSKGLFHKIILQSASVYSNWGVVKTPKLRAIKLCSLLGRDLTDSAEILRFLKTVSAKDLLEAQERLRLSMDYLHCGFIWGPAKDDKSSNPVMPTDPEEAANQGTHLPCIIGCNSSEGIIALTDMSRKDYFELCDLDFRNIFKYNSADILDRYNLDKTKVRRLYYKNERVSDKNLKNYADLYTEFNFFENMQRFIRVQARKSSTPSYFYAFSYDSPNSVGQALVKDAPPGCCQFNDIPYVFKARVLEKLGYDYFKRGTTDYKIMEMWTEMWTNFAKYGKPTVELSELIPIHWMPNRDDTVFRYLDINGDITMQSAIHVEQKFATAKYS